MRGYGTRLVCFLGWWVGWLVGVCVWVCGVCVGGGSRGAALSDRCGSARARRKKRAHTQHTNTQHPHDQQPTTTHLELGDVDVERAVEAQARGERADDLRDEAVEVGVRRALDVEAAAADVVHGLVVEHHGDVGVLEQRVRAQHAVVRLDDGGRDLRRGVDREAELALLAVVDAQALEQQRAEARARAAADGVEHEEALQAGAVVGELADAVEREVDDLLAD